MDFDRIEHRSEERSPDAGSITCKIDQPPPYKQQPAPNPTPTQKYSDPANPPQSNIEVAPSVMVSTQQKVL